MPDPKNPLSKLDRQELLWLAGILKDACRDRLEKNLVSQAFEDRLYQRGPIDGRLDPRPFLKIWEPRYRKFLEVAGELQAMLEAGDAEALAASLRAQFEPERGRPGRKARSRPRREEPGGTPESLFGPQAHPRSEILPEPPSVTRAIMNQKILLEEI